MTERKHRDDWWLAADGKWHPPSTTGGPRTNGFAVASLAVSIVPPLWFLAIIFGHIALNQITRSNGGQKGRGLALAGLVLGYVWLAIFLPIFVLVLLNAGSSL